MSVKSAVEIQRTTRAESAVRAAEGEVARLHRENAEYSRVFNDGVRVEGNWRF